MSQVARCTRCGHNLSHERGARCAGKPGLPHAGTNLPVPASYVDLIAVKFCPNGTWRRQDFFTHLTLFERERDFLQGMVVHPGWHSVFPCQQGVSQVYAALESGQLSLPVSMGNLGLGQYQSLEDLVQVPHHQHRHLLAEMSCGVVDVMNFRRAANDDAYQTMLQFAGTRSPLPPAPGVPTCPQAIGSKLRERLPGKLHLCRWCQ